MVNKVNKNSEVQNNMPIKEKYGKCGKMSTFFDAGYLCQKIDPN